MGHLSCVAAFVHRQLFIPPYGVGVSHWKGIQFHPFWSPDNHSIAVCRSIVEDYRHFCRFDSAQSKHHSLVVLLKKPQISFGKGICPLRINHLVGISLQLHPAGACWSTSVNHILGIKLTAAKGCHHSNRQ